LERDRPWYELAFERGYLEVYPHRDLASARKEVAGLRERGLAGRVLDLGCGFGRHTLAMLEVGLDAFGLDLSRDLLERAGQLPDQGGGERLRGRLLRGDFRRLPFASASFDALTMLFSSFGYFDDPGNRAVLREVARVLRPGGTAILDLMNPSRIRAGLVPESRTERGGLILNERRSLAHGDRRVVKQVELVTADGSELSWHEDVRLYEPSELASIAAAAGLEVQRTEGDFDGAPFDSDSPRQIAWARRR